MRNKWTLLAFTAVIHVTYVVARSLLGVLADPIQAETGLDNIAFGVLTAAIFWTHSLVVPFAGFVGDRFNRAKLIGFAAMAWSVMTVLAGFATGFWSLLLLASVAVIVPQTVFGPTTCALLSDHHVTTRTVALSCHQAAYYVGWFVSGAAIAGILAVCGGTWRAAFFVVGGIGMLVAFVFLLLFGRFAAPEARAVSSEAKPTFAASLRAFFGCPTARLLAVGYIANIFVIFGYSSWAPKFVAQKFALSPAAAGTGSMFWHYAASFVAVLATGVVTDRLVKRFPRVRLAFGTGAMLLAVPASVGFGFAPTVHLTWVSAALLGFALGVFGGNMVSAVYDVVPARFRAGAVGFLNVLAAFIGSFAALMLGALSARLGTRGFELGFALMGVVTIVAALAYAAAAVFTYERDSGSRRVSPRGGLMRGGSLSVVALVATVLVWDVSGATMSGIELSPDGAIRSPDQALAKVRELRACGRVPTGAVVEIPVAPGRYRLTRPVAFGPEDSRIRFVGPKTGEAVFDGGVELPPFAIRADGIWEAPVPAGLTFDQLWVNGRRAPRARTPNRWYLYMEDADYDLPRRSFVADRQTAAVLAELSPEDRARTVAVVWQSWDMGYARVGSADARTGRVTLAEDMARPLFFWDKTRPRYALENYRGALDAPGEWFLDTRASKLLRIPLPGETPDRVRAVASVASGLVTIVGDARKGRPVRDVTFRNIAFEHTGWLLDEKGIRDAQAAVNLPEAAIRAEDAEGLVVENCRIAHAGAHGIWLGRGCRNSRVVHSLVEDLGAGGVYFGATSWDRKRPELNASGLELRDSIVRHGGRALNGAVGVWLGHVRDASVVHNEIADFLYTGVSAGWTWGYAETWNRNNRIEFNHIHHIGQGVLSDMGGVYLLGHSPDTTVCRNWIHDVNGYGDNGSPAWGLYTDEGSQGVLLASNLVERCRSGAIHQHYGKENVYANNICATFEESGVWRSRNESHVMFRVLNNIFWWTNPAALLYRGHDAPGAQVTLPADGNVYWCAGGPVATNAFMKVNWETWRTGGNDAAGAIADPLFVDAANGDWRLRPGSPALKAGFRPFDWTVAGVLGDDADWRRKAAEVTWAAFEDAPSAPRYNRERAHVDFERLSLGRIRSGMSPLAPLNDSFGKAEAVEVVGDAASGGRALKFTDSADLPHSFQPHVCLYCGVTAGVARIRFAYKSGPDARMQFETREYPDGDGSYVTGQTLFFEKGRVRAGGRDIGALPEGVWSEVEVKITLGGGWTVTVAPRGGRTLSAAFPKAQHARFRKLGWIGFISPGSSPSVWYLDDLRLDRCVEL